MASPANPNILKGTLDFQTHGLNERGVDKVPQSISAEILSPNQGTSAAITENRTFSLPQVQSLSPVQRLFLQTISSFRSIAHEKPVVDLLIEELEKENLKNRDNHHAIAFAHEQLGKQYLIENEFEKAIQHVEESLEIHIRFASADTILQITKDKLAYVYYMWGHSLLQKEQVAEAITLLTKAFELCLQVVGDNHQSSNQCRRALEYAHYQLGTVFLEKGQNKEAVEHLNKSFEMSMFFHLEGITGKKFDSIPHVLECMEKLAEAFHQYGVDLLAAKDFARSIDQMLRAIDLHHLMKNSRHWLKIPPDSGELALNEVLKELAKIYEIAPASFQKMLDLHLSLSHSCKESGNVNGMLDSLRAIGEVYKRLALGHMYAEKFDTSIYLFSEATRYFEQIAKIYQEQSNKEADRKNYATQIVFAQELIANISFRELKNFEKAAESFKKCIDFGRDIMSEEYIHEKEMLLALNIHNQAILHYRAKNYPEALQLQLEALALYEKLNLNPILAPVCQGNIATICHELGQLCHESNHLQEAYSYLNRAVSIYLELHRQGKAKLSYQAILEIADTARQVLEELHK